MDLLLELSEDRGTIFACKIEKETQTVNSDNLPYCLVFIFRSRTKLFSQKWDAAIKEVFTAFVLFRKYISVGQCSSMKFLSIGNVISQRVTYLSWML